MEPVSNGGLSRLYTQLGRDETFLSLNRVFDLLGTNLSSRDLHANLFFNKLVAIFLVVILQRVQKEF